jgi:hypothetical protein
MYRRASLLLVLLLAIGAYAAIANAKSKGKKHKVSATVQLATISQAANFPAMGSTVTDAGIVKARPGGRGAETDQLKVTGAPAAGQITLAGTSTLFFVKGTETAKLSIKAVVAADGSVAYTGTGSFTKGTGAYKGITGNVTFSGASPAGSSVVTLQVKGTATY